MRVKILDNTNGIINLSLAEFAKGVNYQKM